MSSSSDTTSLSKKDVLSPEQQTVVWNTKTCEAFNHLHFDKVLGEENIDGTEMYVRDGDEKIDGYEVVKKHKDDAAPTVYFVRSDDIKRMPLVIKETIRLRYKNKVYQVVTACDSLRIVGERILDWSALIKYSGMPKHTNPIAYRLYKNKVLYARTKGQVYYRTVTPSAFGKDKYKEAIAWLLGGCSVLSDPTTPNLFYRACHHRDITITEQPAETSGLGFVKLCNMLMRIGDASNRIDNSARKTEGTQDTAYTGTLSTSFIHNPPSYYQEKGLKCFDDIYPFNVVNRYFYSYYDGYPDITFPPNTDYAEVALEHQDFLRAFIKSAKWYEDNWHTLKNKYPDVLLDGFVFGKEYSRFKDHFIDFARCLSHDAKDKDEYMQLLTEEYKAYLTYHKMVIQPDNNKLSVEEVKIT